MTLIEIGQELKSLRRTKKLTQAHLSALAGVSRLTIARLESGHLGELGFTKLSRLLLALDYELVVRPKGHRITLDDLVASQSD